MCLVVSGFWEAVWFPRDNSEICNFRINGVLNCISLLTEIQLIYNIGLVSSIQQSYLVLYIYIYIYVSYNNLCNIS